MPVSWMTIAEWRALRAGGDNQVGIQMRHSLVKPLRLCIKISVPRHVLRLPADCLMIMRPENKREAAHRANKRA
jgi:hypothetical protein